MNKKLNTPNFSMKDLKPKIYGDAKKVALFTNARNEPHIKEWAAHHLLIGFDLIVIFDHKSDTPISSIFVNFDKRVKVISANIEGPVKMPLMNNAVSIAKSQSIDWMIYLDADEFLNLHKKFIGVKHFLNTYKYAYSIGVNWLMFGSNYLEKEPESLMIENYTRSELLLNKHVKSFVRPQEVLNSDNPHFYHIRNKQKMIGLNNKILIQEPCFNNFAIPFYKSPAYIAHYVNQSEETFTKRKCLTPADDTGTFRSYNVNKIKEIHNQYNDEVNLQPKIKYAENIKNFLSFWETK